MKIDTNNSFDKSTEERILAGARSVFHKKGFNATRTRDIALEANVNVALINYYFRSKEKLFQIIILETLEQFFESLLSILNDKKTTIEGKIELIVDRYLRLLMSQPEIPGFILNEIQRNSSELIKKTPIIEIAKNSYFIIQIKERIKNRHLSEYFIIQNIINIVSLIVFPFIGKPLISEIFNLDQEDFKKIIEERKKMIPHWVQSILLSQIDQK